MTDFTSSLKSRVSALAENARDLTLDFEAASGSRFFDHDDQTMKEVQTLLTSRLDREKLEALRRLVALMSRGTDVSSYFASVVPLIASPNLEIKKLVYIYLLRYAESNPDLALMSINTIQKSLSDKNQIVRGMGLRAMSGIKVPLISGIVILGIRRCVTDLSPFVRKTAAIAIIKLDSQLKDDLLLLLQVLLTDKVPSVLSSALSTWLHVCPERTDLLHRPYRQICRSLVEMDEWGQLVTIRVLSIYVRRCFQKPDEPVQQPSTSQFYDDISNTELDLDPDLILFYKCSLQLCHSRSSAVILSLARLFRDVAPPSYLPRLLPSLIRLLRMRSTHLLYPILSTLAVIAFNSPSLLTPHLHLFHIKPTDTTSIALLKLDILVSSVTETTLLPVLRELDHYSKSSNPEIIHEAICGVARCAMKCSTDKSVALCSTILKGAILSNNDSLSAPAILALRMLIQINPVAYAKYIHLLAQSIAKIHSSSAWAEVIWLAGEHAKQLEGQEADILRISLQDFADQGHSIGMPLTNCKDEEVKLQIITLATKVYAKHFPNPSMDIDLSSPQLQQIDQMYQYAMSLARYDVSYNLRDRARYLRNLSANVSTPDRLFVPKPVPRMTGLGERGQEWNLGSVAQVVGRDIPGEISLPEWGEEIPESGVRNPESVSETMETVLPVTAPKIVPQTSERKKEKKIMRDLDKFYASESESDDDEGVEYDDDEEEDEEETSSGQERNVETDSETETDEDSYVPS